MQGTILTYQKQLNTGLISGNDGVRYNFTTLDIQSKTTKIKEGIIVDFEIDGKNAKQIIVIEQTQHKGKSKSTAALLALFFGGFGIHKFYLGRTAAGILYLIFFWTLIPAIIAIIEFIMLLVMSDSEFNKKFN
jgi:TM2 domain-containing membrane protein YozV